jgi:predicted DNA-binding protein (MmcQ/YjbR family)
MATDIDWLRKTCLAFPSATEQIQWGNDLVFKVGGRMFAVTPLEPASVCVSFKCSDESFAELIERPKIIPAPYMARAKWVALEQQDAVSRAELSELLRASYDLVFAKLSKRAQAELLKAAGARTKSSKGTPVRKKKSARQTAEE